MSTILLKAYMCYYHCNAQLIAIQIYVLPTFITRLLLPRGELTQNLMCFPKTGNLKGNVSVLHAQRNTAT